VLRRPLTLTSRVRELRLRQKAGSWALRWLELPAEERRLPEW
jgi:hypothetical protein